MSFRIYLTLLACHKKSYLICDEITNFRNISEKSLFETGCTEMADFPDGIIDFGSLCAFSG